MDSFCIILNLSFSILILEWSTSIIAWYWIYEFTLILILPVFILAVRSIRSNWSLFTLSIVVGMGSILILIFCAITILSNKSNLIIFYLKITSWLLALIIWLKVPSVPFSFWLPEAHVESNWCGSVILACIILKFSTFGIFVGVCASLTVGGLFGLQIAASISFAISAFNLISTFDSKKVGALLSILHMNFNNLLILNYSSNFNLFITALWISHSILAHYTFFSIGTFYSKKEPCSFHIWVIQSDLFYFRFRVYFYKHRITNWLQFYCWRCRIMRHNCIEN